MPTPTKTSLRVDALAEQWDVSCRTVMREIKRGKIEGFKVGATGRVKAEEICAMNRITAALRRKQRAGETIAEPECAHLVEALVMIVGEPHEHGAARGERILALNSRYS